MTRDKLKEMTHMQNFYRKYFNNLIGGKIIGGGCEYCDDLDAYIPMLTVKGKQDKIYSVYFMGDAEGNHEGNPDIHESRIVMMKDDNTIHDEIDLSIVRDDKVNYTFYYRDLDGSIVHQYGNDEQEYRIDWNTTTPDNYEEVEERITDAMDNYLYPKGSQL